MMEVLVSDIVGLFNRDEVIAVRIKRPDFTFVEGVIAPADVPEFSERLRQARLTDDSQPFDISVLTDLEMTD